MATQNIQQESRGASLIQLLLLNKDLLLPLGSIGILIIMIIPIPPFLMDIMLALSITIGLMILLIAIYTLKPLDFSVFPSLLLIVTLFRLSLNVASTRLILLHGNEGLDAAGKIIMAFGDFVVGGNYVVGIVIFSILVIINFVVITKGAGRIAEVAARFTLDAMPGKQMSIDADLNAGLIDENQARARRKAIEHEADFYGSMDGASKFVRGDAIAGIIITFVNVLGGLVIGVLQHNMDVAKAAANYTLLTVGDGLVSQIPALIVSTAAGIVVTRAASDYNLGDTLTIQVTSHPRALAVTSGILCVFAIIPGLPMIPFLILAGITGGISHVINKRVSQRKEDQIKQLEIQKPKEQEEKIEALLPLDPIALEVGYGLISLVDAEQSGDLLERIKTIRKQFALDMGFVIPPLHIRDNLELKPGGYSLLIKGSVVASGNLMTGHFLAMSPDEEVPKIENAIPTKEPAFGLPALWIPERDKEKALALGYTVVDLSTIVATHLTETIKKHAWELLTKQETQSLIETISKKYPKIIEGVIPEQISLGVAQKVLQSLLKEGVSIRDMVTILETVGDYSHSIKNPDDLTEFVRQAMARTISKQFESEDGKLYLMMLDQEIEDMFLKSIKKTDRGTFLTLEPSLAKKILTAIGKKSEVFTLTNSQPIISCVPAIRGQLKKFLDKFMPDIIVLSHNEILQTTPLESLGIVRLADAD